MTREPLEERYFKWLYRQVASSRITDPQRSYWSLLRIMHATEFTWYIHNDDNRAEDGKELRAEFYNAQHDSHDILWDQLGCSFLEMMIGLARRLSFNGGGAPADWFWHLVDNLGLSDCNDYNMERRGNAVLYSVRVEEALERVIDRNYDRNGDGGLFPLRRPGRSQTRVEIWEQMHSYLNERMG